MAGILKELKIYKKQKDFLVQSYKKSRLGSSMILTGPLKEKKFELALGFAQFLFCENPETSSACGTCPHCLRVKRKQHESLLIIRPEKNVIKKEMMRESLKMGRLKSWNKYTFTLVADAHLMNTSSINSILKAVEDAPKSALFVFICPQLSSLLPTLRSRCQVVKCPPEELKKKDSQYENWVFKSTQRGFSITENLEELSQIREESFKIWEDLLDKKEDKVVFFVKDFLDSKEKALFVCSFWLQLLRDARVFGIKEDLDFIIHDDFTDLLRRLQKSFGKKGLDDLYQKALKASEEISWNANRGLCLENYLHGSRENLCS